MRYADAGSVRIAYDDEGPRADDAVVFLGGWCNSGRSFFAPLAERLAARHRVIRLDWRGHGDSGRPTGSYGFDMWSRAARAVTADYAQYASPLRAAMELDQKPDMLNLYSQPRTAGFLAGQQEFSAANPWFSARQLNGVTHFPALEIPDATAAELG